MMEKKTMVSQFIVKAFGIFLLLLSNSGFAEILVGEKTFSDTDCKSTISKEEDSKLEKSKIYIVEGTIITNLSEKVQIVSIKSTSTKKECKKNKAAPVVATSKLKKQKNAIIKQAVITKKFLPKPFSSELLFEKAGKLDVATVTSSQDPKSKVYYLKYFAKLTLFTSIVIFTGFYSKSIKILKSQTFLYPVRPPPFFVIS